jgi:predicted adenylyl cyclase CyaB
MRNSPTLRNVEIKARCPDPNAARDVLRARNARFEGIDRQTDTYFHVESGRLKLRQGDIENHLIYYSRSDVSGPKMSTVWLAPFSHGDRLLRLLSAALGIRSVVQKTREIYYTGRSKVHLDTVRGLGSFVEIEVVDASGQAKSSMLETECEELMSALHVTKHDLVARSYVDLMEDDSRHMIDKDPPASED